MKPDFVTIVTGFGRCGTSMVMQMLEAAGMECMGEYPAFEPEQCLISGFDGKWVADQIGRAVKVIDPQLPEIMLLAGRYRIIWLDRDKSQQAFSQLKLMRSMFGIPIDSRMVRKMANSYGVDRPKALAKLGCLGPVHRIAFERILESPRTASHQIAEFLGIEPKLTEMAAVVRRRSPEARPDMSLELELIAERDKEKP